MRRSFLVNIFMPILFCVGILYSQPQATDSIACVSVSLGQYDAIQAYFDSSHSYINAGYKTIISNYTVIKTDSDYIHHYVDLEKTSVTWSPSAKYIPNGIIVENINVAYQENALLVTWSIPDTNIADRFHVFYVETDTAHLNMLDSALYEGMTYDDCWDWEIGVNMYDYFFIIPKRVFPAYSSVIRIGIIAEFWFGEEFSTYSKLFLAPDIINKSPQLPDNVVAVEKINLIQLAITGATSQKTSEANHGPLKAIDGKGRNDGDIDSRWACQPIPVWIRFDLGQTKQVSELRYSFYGYQEGRLYTYNVQYSRDNTTWYPLVLSKQQTLNTEWTIDKLPVTVDARYIRVNFTASTESLWAGLWEVKFFGP